VSEHTKKDLLEITDIHPDRLFVTYQAVPSLPANPWSDVAAIRRKYRIGADTYFLFVGNIEPKKNVGRLIQAYLSIDTEIPLVIVGSRAWLWEQELEPLKHISGSRRYKRNVFVVGHVEREELQVFYKGALCLVFPSLYEGFGLPPVEAMSLGCPVITSSVSSLPEVCGDAALYVDPYNVSDIADKMIQVLNDYHSGGKLRTQLVTRGLLRVQMFSEEAFALRLAEAYSRIG
jgi:glycosyltransferase involved in cell wall biosynthesis